MYELPQFNFRMPSIKILFGAVLVAIILSALWLFNSQVAVLLLPLEKQNTIVVKQEIKPYISPISYEQAIIDVVKQASPSVVSIIISKYVPVYERYYTNPFDGFDSPFFDFGPGFDFQIPQLRQKGTQKQEVGGGTGFLISEDGMILTNKHVVADKNAEYTVFTNDGKKYSAKVLAIDPAQDIAIAKIDPKTNEKFQAIRLGQSAGIQIGQTSIAIGNALGEFRNTVSVGIVSGLQRTISASGSSGDSEILEDIIQTDAAINSGNSGGPLLNLRGEVIGINTAVAQGAQNIGFAIPIDRAKRDITQVKAGKKISYPFLGIRYVSVNETIKEKYKLLFEYGAYVLKGDKGEPAVTPGSAAEKAGIAEGDLVLEINEEKITKENSLAKIIQKYSPNDKVVLKISRNAKEISLEVTLGER